MIPVKNILEVSNKLKSFLKPSPLHEIERLSKKYDCKVLLKREDLQLGRSYKIRGAFNKISSLNDEERKKGVVCASAGNHAQGVALSCFKLQIHGTIFMPKTAPKQKVDKVRQFGGEYIDIQLVGDTFDDAYAESRNFEKKSGKTFVHPFNDEKIIEGQGTVGKEIYEQSDEDIDYIFIPIGGGGISSGVGSYFKQVNPKTKIIGVEPQGAASMKLSMDKGKITRFENMDKFVDGAAVAQVGTLNFEICKQVLDDIILVPEGKACSVILEMYNEEAVVVEPSGALSIGALDFMKDEIKGKTIVCLISGGNNDITRMEEIKERSMLYEGLKHYFMISLPKRAGSFKEFVNDIIGSTDEITLIEYDSKKSSGDIAPLLIGVEVKQKQDLEGILNRLKKHNINYNLLNDSPMLFSYLVK